MLILLLISCFATSCLSTWKCWYFSWQNVFGPLQKPYQKALALLYLASKLLQNAANSSGVSTKFANRTDKANLNFTPELYRLIFFRLNWTFRPPPKRPLSVLLNFFSINKFVFLLLLTLCGLCLFCYNAGHHAISRLKHGNQHRVISRVCHFILVTLWCGRTDVRTYGRTEGKTVTWLLRHYQNFLAS